MKFLFLCLVAIKLHAAGNQNIFIWAGYVTKIRCEGKLLISAIGEQGLFTLEALPQNIGCGVLLKPLAKSGRTNLVLETSTGSINVLLEIVNPLSKNSLPTLEYQLRAQH
jgi:hypothetical protein